MPLLKHHKCDLVLPVTLEVIRTENIKFFARRAIKLSSSFQCAMIGTPLSSYGYFVVLNMFCFSLMPSAICTSNGLNLGRGSSHFLIDTSLRVMGRVLEPFLVTYGWRQGTPRNASAANPESCVYIAHIMHYCMHPLTFTSYSPSTLLHLTSLYTCFHTFNTCYLFFSVVHLQWYNVLSPKAHLFNFFLWSFPHRTAEKYWWEYCSLYFLSFLPVTFSSGSDLL